MSRGLAWLQLQFSPWVQERRCVVYNKPAEPFHSAIVEMEGTFANGALAEGADDSGLFQYIVE